MRRSCALALLLVLAAAPASADIGLVADLDGNYQNGPDTLQIEPGDTVLVNVWITGAGDSLQGFGITIGDSSGALAWVAEPAESTYTIPSGWMQVDGVLDQEGRVLLQGQDFSYSAPLILPSQVAELKFTVAPGESCGAIGWDPETSGWQDWRFRDAGFGFAFSPSICLAGSRSDHSIPQDGILPALDSTGRSVVSLEDWPTFPVLATECWSDPQHPGSGVYSIHLRTPPTDPILVAIHSPDGSFLVTASPSKQGDRLFRSVSTRTPRGWEIGIGPIPMYPQGVQDERAQRSIESVLGDSAYVAAITFDTYVLPGYVFAVHLGAPLIFQESIPETTTFPLTPVLPPSPGSLSLEERFELFTVRPVLKAMEDADSTVAQIERRRTQLWELYNSRKSEK